MKKTVLTFGLISGAMMMMMMWGTLPFADKIGPTQGMYIGYTTMVLSFMLVFFGIRSYRENVGAGTITFGRAFAVGILITLISSALYVLTWEIIYFGLPGFADRFLAMAADNVRTKGGTPQQIQAGLDQIKQFRIWYDKPLLNVAITFMEPFPIGLIITLISALILRKKIQSSGGHAAIEAQA